MSEHNPSLREQILDVCNAANPDMNVLVQTLVDVLMVTLIAVGPDADAAERNLRRITQDMLGNIRRAYGEYHDMREASLTTRQ